MFINSLYQLPEEEMARGYSILPEHTSSFTKLHTNDECMQVPGVTYTVYVTTKIEARLLGQGAV